MSVPSPLELSGRMERIQALGAGGLLRPSPASEAMEAEVRDYRPAEGDGVGASLIVRFPVLDRFRTSTGRMASGMVAAAVDTAVDSLSSLVAPPSETAQLTVTYLAPVAPDLDHIEVEARLVARSGRQRVYDATVVAPGGTALAIARATHTVVGEERDG